MAGALKALSPFREVLDCGSPLPLFTVSLASQSARATAHSRTRARHSSAQDKNGGYGFLNPSISSSHPGQRESRFLKLPSTPGFE
jgi:hypothetical protein